MTWHRQRIDGRRVFPDKHNPTIVEVTLVNRVTVVKVHQLDEEMLLCGLLTRATAFHHCLEQVDLYVLRRSACWLKMKPQ